MNKIKDLSVTFESILTFNVHLNKIVSKAYKILGFIMRSAKFFVKYTTIVTLYNAYVYSQLSFCSTVCNPYYNVQTLRVERIQKKFLTYLSRKAPVVTNKYESLCYYFGILKLKDRRQISDVLTFTKIVNGHIDCPPLLGSINFIVPSHNFRNKYLFKQSFARTNTNFNAPLVRLPSLINNLTDEVNLDIFRDGILSIKKNIKAHLVQRIT